jgi:hypothetical protein
MEEGDATITFAHFPVALHPIRSPPDPDDSGQVLTLPPNRTPTRAVRADFGGDETGPFRPAAPRRPELRNRLLMASAPLRGQN